MCYIVIRYTTYVIASAFDGLKMALKDVKVYLFALMTCAVLVGLGFINFFPT